VRRVFRKGRAIHGDRVVMFVAAGSGEVATVAGGRVGGAVARNRARRVMRAALAEILPNGLPERDVVVVARSAIRGSRTPDVATELRRLLEMEPTPA
jgi:ribonuclease P protein component